MKYYEFATESSHKLEDVVAVLEAAVGPATVKYSGQDYYEVHFKNKYVRRVAYIYLNYLFGDPTNPESGILIRIGRGGLYSEGMIVKLEQHLGGFLCDE